MKLSWILGSLVALGAALMLLFLLSDSGRERAGRTRRQVESSAGDAGASDEAEPETDLRTALDSGPLTTPSEPVAKSPYATVDEWRVSKDAVLEGTLLADQGIPEWRGFKVYITSFAPPPFRVGNKNSNANVDLYDGSFSKNLPLGPAEVLWYHPAAGKGPVTDIDIEEGLNTVTLKYEGPDPVTAIFVDVTSAEPIAANQISATREDTGQVSWAMDFLEEGRFVIPGLVPGSYVVKVERPEMAAVQALGVPGSRVRIELDES